MMEHVQHRVYDVEGLNLMQKGGAVVVLVAY
jgi:hypothetical protein